IIITQSKAHYRKEETVDNKMTYPLPPFSTVIGAIHRACNFKEYHPMNLCIQGSYSSLTRQSYTDYCFLDSVMDDRGILVKMKNSELLNSGFDRVAEAKKSTGNSFKKQITIDILNKELFEEFLSLKNIDKEMLKNFSDSEKTSYTENLNRYKSLTTSLKSYEVLNEVKLLIHITSEEEGLLEIIEDNIYNLKALGRSEDFVNVEECEIVNLRNITEEDGEIFSPIPGYINMQNFKSDILLDKNKPGIKANGTKYYLGKVYTRDKGFRDFGDKVKVLYTSKYSVEEEAENIYIDEIDEKFIVQFS
ncbi:MAG: CRISPR-associated protein Cas5, partial [Fusobacteriaceae bacterium]